MKDNHVHVVVDVRRYPGSSVCPQFNKERMIMELKKENLSYIHIEKLGGRSSQIPKNLDTMITTVDGEMRALERMPII